MASGTPTPAELTPAQLQEQIAALKQQLAQAQKLTALGELLSTTTHEFNNVLMTIINYAKLGMRHTDQPSRDKAFEKILGAANRAAKITQTTLGFARNRAPGFEPTDLTQLIDDTVMLLERELQKYRITIERQFQPVPRALVNGNQIQQVLVNLIVNARQAMSQGGRLTIKLAHDLEHNFIDLTIRDTGSGIPADKLRNIFDAFYTTKSGPDASGKGGTGLGLSMCREIIQSHQGRIRVESTVGKGTAFTLKLPPVPSAAGTSKTEAAPRPIAAPIAASRSTPISGGIHPPVTTVAAFAPPTSTTA